MSLPSEHRNIIYRGFEIQLSKYYTGYTPWVSVSVLAKDARAHSYSIGIRTAYKFNGNDFSDSEKRAKEWIDQKKLESKRE
jgi:hypothetical protein